MIDTAYLENFAAALRNHEQVDRLDTGLSDSEIEAIQGRFGFTFPPDLRAVLQFAVPVGKQFPSWRNGSNQELISKLLAARRYPVRCGPPLNVAGESRPGVARRSVDPSTAQSPMEW